MLPAAGSVSQRGGIGSRADLRSEPASGQLRRLDGDVLAVRRCVVKHAVYQRRRPERTAVYQGVRQNLETALAQWRAGGLGWVNYRRGDSAADTGTCRRANNYTGYRTSALTTAADKWTVVGCSGKSV